MKIDPNKCTGCERCVRDCPLGAIDLEDEKAVINESCVECRACLKVCPVNAVIEIIKPQDGAIVCRSCPVACSIPEDMIGACKRYRNAKGELKRTRPLLKYEDIRGIVGPETKKEIKHPIITAIGAGGTYPDYVPAPYIVSYKRDGVDVITAVTEVPLSYSGIKVKIDTDLYVGAEGSEIKFDGRTVGMVETEEYGSKILAIGGVNRLTGKAGFTAARAIASIANREALKLSVKGGAKLEVQVGKPPVINGLKSAKMRVGCGSATAGLFAKFFEKAADEVIVLDSHITSLFTHHAAGGYLGLKPSGLELTYTKSTPGRYFGRHGGGWGGTDIREPLDIISSVDQTITKPGSTLLITETTGERAAMFQFTQDNRFEPIELTEEAAEAVEAIKETCQESLVSALYVGGVGGSARAGVVKYPLRLTRAVHENKATLTCGGSQVFVLPGGGITFYVDVGKVTEGSFTWTPTPATIAPIEYTMLLEDYEAMGGHMEAVKPFSTLEPIRLNVDESAARD